jgi:outer membrane murein-binding lipoprotein Lpp
MKKSIFMLAITTVIAGTMLTGCQSSSAKVEDAQEKVQNAQEQVASAQEELNQAIKDSIQQFKKESEARIIANEKSIADFRARIAREGKESRVRYEQRLAELEQQNRDMKMRLENFNEEQKDKWESFRVKFNEDMEKQGKAFRDFWSGKK